jgi:hypothetical protein
MHYDGSMIISSALVVGKTGITHGTGSTIDNIEIHLERTFPLSHHSHAVCRAPSPRFLVECTQCLRSNMDA